MSSNNTSENEQTGLRIQTVAFWLAVVSGILLIVTIVTMIRVSVRFNYVMDKTNAIIEKDVPSWSIVDMGRYIRGQQKYLVEIQDMVMQQQIYCIILILLLVAAFIIIGVMVIRPIHKFEIAIDKDEELPSIGSTEMRNFAENFNTSKRNNAASKLVFQHEAEHDALTGVFNRGAFEKMKQYLSGSLEPLAVLLIDVDLFKHVNDNYGHEVGDVALKKVSSLLTEKFRSSDLVFRIGGDEFCVIMQKITPSEKDVLGDKINAINAELDKTDDKMPAKLSVSVGIAFSQFGFNEDLFAKTDKALYYTKEHGRKGYTFYHSKIEEKE